MAWIWKKISRSWLRMRLGEAGYAARRTEERLAAWRAAGRPVPPPHEIKVEAVAAYAARFGCGTLIETGTYRGDMIAATRAHFGTVHSVELAPALYEDARKRFAGDAGVHLHQGDSGALLGEILGTVTDRPLLWLDGHWSGGPTAHGDQPTPILRELEHVFAHTGESPVVLIDDARCFGAEPDYPSLDELRACVAAARPDWVFEVEDDLIRTHAPA